MWECKERWPTWNCNRRDPLLRRVCFHKEILLPSFRKQAFNPHLSTAKASVVSSPLHCTSEFGGHGVSMTEENIPKFNTSLGWAVFFLRAFTGGWTLGWPEAWSPAVQLCKHQCWESQLQSRDWQPCTLPHTSAVGRVGSISVPGVPGVNEWQKGMFKRCVPLSQRFKLLHNWQHCEAPPGRKLLVVALSVPPCCESLWAQVQRNWYQGKSIEIITLKNQRRGEGRGEKGKIYSLEGAELLHPKSIL